MRCKNQDRRPLLETLEGRRLLSGNVTVDASNPAILVITGDNQSNNIEVVRHPGADYTITGHDGTSVNGIPAGTPVVFPSPGGSAISANMGNGSDVLDFQGNGSGTLGDFSIAMGNGEDSVSISNTHVFGNLNINTGNGGDGVVISGSIVNQKMLIDLGNGPDSLTFVGGNTAGAGSILDGGRGPNTLLGTPPAGATVLNF